MGLIVLELRSLEQRLRAMQDIKDVSMSRRRVRSLSRILGQLLQVLEGRTSIHEQFISELNDFLFYSALSQVPERYRTMQEFLALTERAVWRLEMAAAYQQKSAMTFDRELLYSALLEVARTVHGLCFTATVHNLNSKALASLERTFVPLCDAAFTALAEAPANGLEALLDGPDYYDLPVEQQHLLSDLQIFLEGWLGPTGEILTQVSIDRFPRLRNPKNFLERTIKKLARNFSADAREEILMEAQDIWEEIQQGGDWLEFFSHLIADDYHFSQPPRTRDARLALFELVADLPVQMMATAAVICSNRAHREYAQELARMAGQCFSEYLILAERHGEVFPDDWELLPEEDDYYNDDDDFYV